MFNSPEELLSRVASSVNDNCGNPAKLKELRDELFNELQDLVIDMGDLGLNHELFKACLAAYVVVSRITGGLPQPTHGSLTDQLLRLVHDQRAGRLGEHDVSDSIRELEGRVRCGEGPRA